MQILRESVLIGVGESVTDADNYRFGTMRRFGASSSGNTDSTADGDA